LFTAAHEANVGDFTTHFLLSPPGELPARLAIDHREFRLRLLAATATWGEPVAWTTPPNLPDPGVEHFPATRELATRLTVRILERDAAADTVRAEIGDVTAHVGGSRQRVSATWDGEQWTLKIDPARIVW
ncbi:MAG: hypothetical protein ACYTGG_04760, partial [Planctomycetota bacterium]